MEENRIRTISIEDFSKADPMIEYADEDVIVTSRITNFSNRDDMVRMNFFAIVVCEKGRTQLDINGKPCLLQEGNVMICLPTTVLSNVMVSPDFEMSMVGFSPRFLQRMIKKEADTGKVMQYIYKNPVQIISNSHKGMCYHYYSRLVFEKIKEDPSRYQQDIIHFLFAAIFHEMLTELFRFAEDMQTEDAETRQSMRLFQHFMSEVTKDGGIHRSVAYYADRLCYSPKYLSSVVKRVTGRTAMDWINEMAVEQIKLQLKHSDLSMKEISERFEFPNQSFFGKYMKSHLGMSPARYRERGQGGEAEAEV